MKDNGEVNIMNKTVDIRRFYKEDASALEDVIRKTWKQQPDWHMYICTPV